MLYDEALNAACHLLDMFEDDLEKAIEYANALAKHDPVYEETVTLLRNELPPEILEKESLEKKKLYVNNRPNKNGYGATIEDIMKMYETYKP